MIRAEQRLAWYFNHALTRMAIRAVDYEALANHESLRVAIDNDSMIAIVTKARPIREALGALSGHHRKVLRLAYTERAWQGQDWHDYLVPYGARLAAIVREYKQPRDWAEQRLRAALRRFCEVYGAQ